MTNPAMRLENNPSVFFNLINMWVSSAPVNLSVFQMLIRRLCRNSFIRNRRAYRKVVHAL